ncbi:hypothetical protein ATE47_01350 [Chryseobacterium sp. IHB B 17019]|uniref:hypothetical protein n=1 Tax=Chryseobacterium sp. IHB B 17019 TaxID=1721091 RepID=UPI00071FC5A9|nr:hypothetical protein [Chryseobacterium sp. IHB B 17019]ALR29258.1 hypothetical protein ATE47_01350 [Chryseobacterium sp. IHB B 17019]
MNYKPTIFIVLISVFFSCNNKVPYIPDYEMARGTVIGMETCKTDVSTNAWLISFPEPGASNKVYGDNITYNNKSYTNVVRTLSLPDSLRVIGNKYYLEFNIEPKSTPDCQVPNADAYNLTKIQIRKAVRISG